MVGPIARGLSCVAVLAGAVSAQVGCGGEPPTPRLISLVPARGFSDRPRRVLLLGEAFVPSFHVDLETGERQAQTTGFRGWVGERAGAVMLESFGWRSVGEMSATLRPGLPAGLHPVVLVDPRGALTELPRGYLSLGPDQEPPSVTVVRPTAGTPMAPGGPLLGEVQVSDEGMVQEVSWRIHSGGRQLGGGSCPVSAEAADVRCNFQVTVPRELRAGQQLELEVTASDAASPPNPTAVARSFTLGEPPAVGLVAPARGGTAGGTEVVVRGTRFLPGSQVFFGRAPLVPDGGIHVDERTITGRTPAHAAGPAEIRVVTPLGEGKLAEGFEYLAPPVVSTVDPPRAPSAGGTQLRVLGSNFSNRTRVYLGRTLRTARPLEQPEIVSTGELRGQLPPGNGTVTVFAVDTESGWGSLTDGFSWTGP